MFQRMKMNARAVYLFIEFSASAFFPLMFDVTSKMTHDYQPEYPLHSTDPHL